MTKDPTVVTTLAFWKPATCGGVAVNRPALVQTRESANQMEVVIVEPTEEGITYRNY
ncbi:hypothetical protein JCM18918_3779 [Cutibacterium acnes JCM 18918]|nr:hypothetical protein JCM18918_3779 [Cutibacterium acnes JCM 18918]